MPAITYATVAEQTSLVSAAEALLRRTIEERTGIIPLRAEPSLARIVLAIGAGIGEEGFRIEGAVGGPVRITGNDERGLIYGIGKFLRDSRLEKGAFTPGSWRGVSVPQKKVRGMYFATHFHNWYHDAPVEDIVRYVEDLALWGCNALTVWFDMHHYSGMNAPEARTMVERLHAILAAAQAVGIRPGLTMLANEGFSATPAELRATNAKDQNGYFAEPCGFYGAEICPNAPGGTDLILKLRTDVLDAFRDIRLEYFMIWPYDQGGCTCGQCAPWGTNGFLKTAEPVARMLRKRFPDAKIVLSTWYFDRFVKGEWAGLQDAFAKNKPDWVDYLMIDGYWDFPAYPLEHGVPGGFPVLNFAEISMATMFPWGGFGANPWPRKWQADYRKTTHLLDGGFPYSEGIYEDLNKVLQFQFGWSPEREAVDIVREYAAGYFCPEQADAIVEAVMMMDEMSGISMEEKPEGLRFRHWNPPVKAEACFAIMDRVDRVLPEGVRRSWRWRILWLRAALDLEIKRNEGKPSEVAAGYFRELVELYHARHAEGAVHPPVIGGINRIDASVQAG